MNINRVIIFACLFISFQSKAFFDEPLIFVQTHLGHKFQCAHNTLKKAYKSLDIDISIKTFPAKRALKMANEGHADGEMLRVKGIEASFPNLVHIPVPLCSVKSILVVNDKVKAKNYDELRKYRFGTVAGFAYQEDTIKKHKLNAIRVNQNKKLIDLMLINRVDAIFLSKQASIELLNNPQKKAFKILNEFTQSVYFYHYLHKKHYEIIPLITNELKKMELNGEIDLEEHHR